MNVELAPAQLPRILLSDDGGQIAILGDVTKNIPRIIVSPRGLQGPPGPPADTLIGIARAVVSGHRAVIMTSTGIRHADLTRTADADEVVGISENAAAIGDSVVIIRRGLMIEPSWHWTPDVPIWCAIGGTLTQTPPDTAGGDSWLWLIGFAIATDTMVVNPRDPIVLTQ